MEMNSSVMRFAMATYFMKRGSSSRPSRYFNDSSWVSPSFEPSFATSCLSDEDVAEREEDEEVEEDVDSEFSHVVSTHVSNLRQLLVEQRFQEWSSDLAELREYVFANGLVGSLVAVLVKMIKRQEQNAVCIVQVIERLCFEAGGEPSQVFDELTELLLEYCYENKDACVATWLLRALSGVTHGLRQYEQRYGVASGNQHVLGDLDLEKALASSSLPNDEVYLKDGSPFDHSSNTLYFVLPSLRPSTLTVQSVAPVSSRGYIGHLAS